MINFKIISILLCLALVFRVTAQDSLRHRLTSYLNTSWTTYTSSDYPVLEHSTLRVYPSISYSYTTKDGDILELELVDLIFAKERPSRSDTETRTFFNLYRFSASFVIPPLRDKLVVPYFGLALTPYFYSSSTESSQQKIFNTGAYIEALGRANISLSERCALSLIFPFKILYANYQGHEFMYPDQGIDLTHSQGTDSYLFPREYEVKLGLSVRL